MKRLLSTLTAAIVAVGSVFAQNAYQTFKNVEMDNQNNAPYFGVRVALDITAPTKLGIDTDAGKLKTSAINTGAGFSVGGIYNLPVWRNLYVEPGLNLYYHRNNYNKNWVGIINSAAKEKYDKIYFTEIGFSVPVMIGYRFDFDGFSLSAFTGPEFMLGVSGKEHYSTHNDKLQLNGSQSAYADGGFNRGNILWRFGVGATISQKYYVALSGGPGLCNWQKETGTSQRYNIASITLGYNF